MIFWYFTPEFISELLQTAPEKAIFGNMPEFFKSQNPVARWIKRFGVAGFLFFLIKGLLWLALIIAASVFGYDLFS